MVDVVPRDHVFHACGGRSANSERESLVEGPLQESQNIPALRGIWEIRCTGCTLVSLTWVGMLLLCDQISISITEEDRHEQDGFV